MTSDEPGVSLFKVPEQHGIARLNSTIARHRQNDFTVVSLAQNATQGSFTNDEPFRCRAATIAQSDSL